MTTDKVSILSKQGRSYKAEDTEPDAIISGKMSQSFQSKVGRIKVWTILVLCLIITVGSQSFQSKVGRIKEGREIVPSFRLFGLNPFKARSVV